MMYRPSSKSRGYVSLCHNLSNFFAYLLILHSSGQLRLLTRIHCSLCFTRLRETLTSLTIVPPRQSLSPLQFSILRGSHNEIYHLPYSYRPKMGLSVLSPRYVTSYNYMLLLTMILKSNLPY